MKPAIKLAGYLVLWLILWACLALLWQLPVELPIKAAKGVVNGTAKLVTLDASRDINENSHPLIDKIHDELEDYNSYINRRPSPMVDPSSSSYPMGASAYDPAGQIGSISCTSYWPYSKTTNSFGETDPFGRPIDRTISNGPYSGRGSDITKSAGWSTYKRPASDLRGSMTTNPTYQGSMVDTARSSTARAALGGR